MSEPTTEAGKRLHRMLFGEWDDAVDGPKRFRESDVAVIEAEAREQERIAAAAPKPSIDGFRFVDVPVIDGVATLPNGRTVQSEAAVVRVVVTPDADDDSLDAAWAEAEAAAHPEALIRAGRTGMTRTGWATAYLHGELIGTEFADTLPAALRALAARLREPVSGR